MIVDTVVVATAQVTTGGKTEAKKSCLVSSVRVEIKIIYVSVKVAFRKKPLAESFPVSGRRNETMFVNHRCLVVSTLRLPATRR